ncbi:MAG: N-6 DNA methylase [Catonella sp.]
MAKVQSVEPNIADLANGWLRSYGLEYKLEQESLNSEIDKALEEYVSKNGGVGGNRPDAKLLIKDEKTLKYYPILIEYKGYKDRLVKLDDSERVDNRTSKNEPNYKNINSYAVNGAVHYANAVLHYTSYTEVIAIGVTGYKKEDETLEHNIGVYYVSKDNFGIGQEVGKYTDLSFLRTGDFSNFIEGVKKLTLTSEELEAIKSKREKEIDASLVKLNNDIYNNEKGLSESDRVHLVAASIMATLGIPGEVSPLEKSDLKSSSEEGNTDGEILVRKIEAFLKKKNLPIKKQEMIVRTLKNTLVSENINSPKNGESQLKRIFVKIVDDLGIYYKIGLTTDFTGKLFNEMYSWLGFSQDKLNDVVLTPSYVAKLLVKLARVDMDSYVWDFATGSAGLLVAAMNEMIMDAKINIKSPMELEQKMLTIKAEQLLGLEVLSNIYMLAILNMILMGDGSSNILNMNSLTDFDGKYGFGEVDKDFPATAFVLNPPYSAKGNGMIFVEKALAMMNKGYAAIIIQSSAGSGKAIDYNKKILERNTLLASIKMPGDLFLGKSSVQTYIYVFRVGEAHQKDEIVKFIDFSNDGYERTNRKKASSNLKDIDRANERYQEIADLVRFGKSKLNIFTEKEYFEGHIDPKNGADWNQTAEIDTRPTLKDFKKTVADYLAWEVSNLLKGQGGEDDCLGK